MPRHTFYLLFVLLCIATAAHAASASGTAEQEAGSNSTAAQAPTAHHKTLTPLIGTDIGLFIVVAVALFIASGAGVGGGVLVVPSLLIISQFTAIAAVALSNITILASAIANLIFNVPRKSVLRPGPLIDWDLVLLFGPPTVMGSIAGSYINMVIPSWVTKVCLFILLVPMAWRMVDKARSLFARETAAKRAVKTARVKSYEPDDLDEAVAAHAVAAGALGSANPPAAAEAPQGDSQHLGSSCSGSSGTDGAVAIAEHSSKQHKPAHGNTLHSDSSAAAHPAQQAGAPRDVEMGVSVNPTHAQAGQEPHLQSGGTAADSSTHGGAAVMSCWQHPSTDAGWSCQVDPATCQAVRGKLDREQAKMLPPFQVSLLVLLLADVAVSSLLAGYLLSCATWQYWVLVLSPLLVMLLVWGVARHHIMWKAAWKVKLDIQDAGDLKWDARTTTSYPAICISAGIIAGMLGLGGGLVLAPLMLELGVNPAVSAASTQVTLLISSSTSAIVYAVNGAVPWDYGIVLIVIGFVATLMGQWLVSWLVRRLGRPSILVITLAVMFTVATFAAAAVVVITAIDLARHPEKVSARKAVCPA